VDSLGAHKNFSLLIRKISFTIKKDSIEELLLIGLAEFYFVAVNTKHLIVEILRFMSLFSTYLATCTPLHPSLKTLF
jgi:hypothetical protein